MKFIKSLCLMTIILSLLSACKYSLNPTLPLLDATNLTTAFPATSPTIFPAQPTAAIPTITPPTTLPMPTETTLPPMNQAVTPINTYVRGEKADGTPADAVPLDTDTSHPDFTSIQPGQVMLSQSVMNGVQKFHRTTVFYVAICFTPSIDWDLGEYPYGAEYDALRQEVMRRFEEAGYPVRSCGSYCEERCMFYVYISAEQLLALNCGDDLAIYVYIPRYAY